MALHYALHHAVSNDDFIYSVKCILDCLPVSVRTETVYSDDQFANRYSNPYKLYISAPGMLGASCFDTCQVVQVHLRYSSYSFFIDLFSLSPLHSQTHSP